MRENIHIFILDLETWMKVDENTWIQRYTLTTLCRMLYSAHTGKIASKKASLIWAKEHVSSTWHTLIQAALDGRILGFSSHDRPTQKDVQATLDFAEYTKNICSCSFKFEVQL